MDALKKNPRREAICVSHLRKTSGNWIFPGTKSDERKILAFVATASDDKHGVVHRGWQKDEDDAAGRSFLDGLAAASSRLCSKGKIGRGRTDTVFTSLMARSAETRVALIPVPLAEGNKEPKAAVDDVISLLSRIDAEEDLKRKFVAWASQKWSISVDIPRVEEESESNF